MNKIRASAQPPPQPTSASGLPLSARDRLLVARAIQFTRVSYFTSEERDRLAALVTTVTGYRILGGI